MADLTLRNTSFPFKTPPTNETKQEQAPTVELRPHTEPPPVARRLPIRNKVVKVDVVKKQGPYPGQPRCEKMFMSSRSAHRHLWQIHHLASSHDLIKGFKMDRWERCTICQKQITRSNRVRHEKDKHLAYLLGDWLSRRPLANLVELREKICNYRRPSLFAGVTFQDYTGNTKTANTKSNNHLKTGVPFLFFLTNVKDLHKNSNYD